MIDKSLLIRIEQIEAMHDLLKEKEVNIRLLHTTQLKILEGNLTEKGFIKNNKITLAGVVLLAMWDVLNDYSDKYFIEKLREYAELSGNKKYIKMMKKVE